MFFAFANDRDDRTRYLRNLAREASGVRDVLGRAQPQALWEVVERQNATLDDILDVFQDPRYRGRIVAFHFGGHADSDELTLESPIGAAMGADASIFVTFLRQQQSLRFVFLNGCSTQGQVANLLAAGIPAVIATSCEIDDDVATRFAIRFYQALSGGAGLRVAFEEASASQKPGPNASLRGIHRKHIDVMDGRVPWGLHIRDGAETVREWTLGESAGEPLLGLPPLPPMDLPAKPYRHLNWFAREHAPIFFGRGREIRALFECLTSSHTSPITLLYGQSGVGKSSLLAAGLLPRLAAVSTTRYARRDRDVRLRTGLRQTVGVDTAVPASLRDAWVDVERATGRPLIILFDQIEEAFTRPHAQDPAEFDEFLADLCDVFLDPGTRPAGKLLLGFRKEWLADIEDRLARVTLPHRKVFVDHLDLAGITDAVIGPARAEHLRSHYRLSIDAGLPERIASDLLEDRGSPIAPALQLLLSKLWDRAAAESPESPRFTSELYTQLKREGVLLDDFLEQQLAALQAWQPTLARAGLFLDFLAQHTTSIGSARPRSSSQLRSLYGHHLALLPELVARARELMLLVDATGIDGDATTEGMTRLVHDAVAQLVRRRFEQSDLPGQQARRLLERQARAWADGGVGETLDDVELEAVEAALPGMRAWTPDETRLIEASRADREVRSKHLRADAVVRALLTSKEAQDDPLVAALLIAEFTDLPEPDEHVGTALRIAQRPFPSSVLEGHEHIINALAFSPDGKLVASGSEDGTARIWTLDGSQPCVVLGDHSDAVTSVAFSPDGRLLATASVDGTALLHHLDQSTRPQLLFGHTGVVHSCVFSPDGRLVSTASTDGTARVWACDDSAPAIVLDAHQGSVRSVVFNSLGTKVLTIDDSGRARVWDLLKQLVGAELPAGQPVSAAVSLANGTFVTASSTGEVRQWEVFRAEPLQSGLLLANIVLLNTTPPFVGPILCATPHGSIIAHSVATDSVTVRDLAEIVGSPARLDRNPLGTANREVATLRVPGVQIVSAVLDPSGNSLIARCGDGTARLWLLPELDHWTIMHPGSPVHSAAFSSDGQYVATGASDGTIRIWPVGRAAEPRSIALTDHFVTAIASCLGDYVDVDTRPPNAVTTYAAVETVRVSLRDGAEPTHLRRRFSELEMSSDRTRLLVRRGRQLIVLSVAPTPLPLIVADDFSTMTSHAFAADGSRLVAHATDGTLTAWNLTKAEVEWRRRGVVGTQYSSDGMLVIAQSAEGVTRLLETSSGDTVWQHAGVVQAEFFGRASGSSSWIRLDLTDGTTQLRQANGSGNVTRFANAGDRRGEDVPELWTSASGGWAAYMPPHGGPVTVCSIDRPSEQHVLTTDAQWADHLEARNIFFVLRRNGDLLAWKTDRWGTEPPDERRLIDTNVARVGMAPNHSRAVVQSVDGTLKLLDRDLSRVEETLFVAGGWAWNTNGTWLAAWSTPPMVLHAVELGFATQRTELGFISESDGSGIADAAWWLDERHIGATVIHGYLSPPPRLALWNVRAQEMSSGQSTPTPRILDSKLTTVRQAMFRAGDDAWVYHDALDGSWTAKALYLDRNNGLTVELPVNARALEGMCAFASACAFHGKNRLATAWSADGAWWVSVDHLDRYRSDMVASGRGTVRDLEFSADGRSIDVRLDDETTVSVAADGPFTDASMRESHCFAHAVLPADGAAIAITASDGTARIWRPDDDGPPLHVAAPDRRILLRLRATKDGPEPAIATGPGDHAWIVATLDDGTACFWPGTDQPSPQIVAEPGCRIVDVSRGYASNDVYTTLDDGTSRRWVVMGDRIQPPLPVPSGPIPDQVAPDGRRAIRFLASGPCLVRCDDDTALPIPLGTDTEEIDRFEFSADGQWLVGEVRDPGEQSAWAVRVWNVDAPASSRLVPNVELVRVQGNLLHFRQPSSRMIAVVRFSGTGEPVLVPEGAAVVDDRTVIYGQPPAPDRGVHLTRVDQPHEPIALVPRRSRATHARACHDHVLGRLESGEICVWDLTWRAVAERVRASTSERLAPEQRRRLLGETEGREAQSTM
jgi:WD40 repeat protein